MATSGRLDGVAIAGFLPRLWPTTGAGSQRTSSIVDGLLRHGATLSAFVPVASLPDEPPPDRLATIDLHHDHPLARLPWRFALAAEIAGLSDVHVAANRRLRTDALALGTGDRRFDLVLSCGAPWSSVSAAAAVAEALGVPHVADLRDEWADNPFQRLQGPWHRSRSKRHERRALAGAAAVTAPFPAPLDLLDPAPERRSRIVPHGCDVAAVRAAVGPAPAWRPPEPLRLVFAGARYRNINEGPFLRTLAQVPDRPPIHLQLVGSDRPLAAPVPAGVTVELVPHVGYGELLGWYRQAHALLTFQPAERGPTWVPSKLPEYEATGRPILGSVPAGSDLADHLATTAGAHVALEHDAASLGDALHGLVGSVADGIDHGPARDLRDRNALGDEVAEVVAQVLSTATARP